MNRLSSILLPVSFALAAGACGGGGVSSPADAFHQQVAAACQKAFDCMSSYDPAANGGATFEQTYGPDEATCESNFNGLLTQTINQYTASVDAGRITFNGDDAATCIDAFNALSCDAFWNQTSSPDPSCDTTFVGTVDDGASCTISDDCSTAGDTCSGNPMVCTAG